MRAQSIVDQLAAVMPKYTDAFSSSSAITSITVSGSTATVTTPTAHGIVENQNVSILNATAPVQISNSAFLRAGSSATFETLQDHDITLSQRDIANGGKTIDMSGAIEPEFNGTFQLIQVVNRRKLIIAVTDSGPTTISGSPIVENAGDAVFNGLVKAVNVTTMTFDYELPVSYPLDAIVDNATVQTSIRILSVLDIEQYLQDVYTKKSLNDHVLVVQLGDVTQSKKRNEETDADSSSAGNDAFTPVLIQPFAVYIVMNMTGELTASQARDNVESEYIPALFRAVLRSSFDTGFTYSRHGVTFKSHGVFAYSDAKGKNKAIYAHEVTFEQLVTLTKSDAADTDISVAMRDVSYALTVDLGTGTLSATIDLDEVPIP